MGLANHSFPETLPEAGGDRRASPRFTSLIRAAKLVCGKGEFVCVVRDVSSGGVRLRCFHAIPHDPDMALELQNGDSFAIEWIRGENLEASFRFREPGVNVERVIRENWEFPRRPLRLAMALPVTLRTLTGPISAFSQNLSPQGCSVEVAHPLAIAQSVILDIPHLPSTRAKVCWRRDGKCGLVFDDTFSLSEFARHAARLQCPALLRV